VKDFLAHTLAMALRAGEPIPRDDLVRYLRLALEPAIAEYVVNQLSRLPDPKRGSYEERTRDRMALRLYEYYHDVLSDEYAPAPDERIAFPKRGKHPWPKASERALGLAARHAGIRIDRLRRLITKSHRR
jgi:hypothetical protein